MFWELTVLGGKASNSKCVNTFFLNQLRLFFNACACSTLVCVCKRERMCLPERGIKTIYKQRKLPIATLKKALSMTNKSLEIHEIWLPVLTACHTRRPKDWSCAVGQRWVILYWNAKWLLTEQSWCCFKMHENCMEQRKQRVAGNGFCICMWASKPVVSVVTHKTGPGHWNTGPDQGH